MTFGLKDAGEEFMMRMSYETDVDRPDNLTVGLYEDGVDDLNDVNNVNAITTEPEGQSYARQSLSFGANNDIEIDVDVSSQSNWLVRLDDLVFDVTDSERWVDGVFVVCEYERYTNSEPVNNLLWNTELSQRTHLSDINGTMMVQGAALQID
jgi:hypothetical protein